MTYIFLFFIHWIADFVFQTDWMAQNKSKNLAAMGAHIACYTSWMLAFAIGMIPSLEVAVLWALVNGLIHFFVDSVTSRITGYFWREKKVHAFFVTIGFDQFLHAATLIATWNYLT